MSIYDFAPKWKAVLSLTIDMPRWELLRNANQWFVFMQEALENEDIWFYRIDIDYYYDDTEQERYHDTSDVVIFVEGGESLDPINDMLNPYILQKLDRLHAIQKHWEELGACQKYSMQFWDESHPSNGYLQDRYEEYFESLSEERKEHACLS